jgi:hypothetical protein
MFRRRAVLLAAFVLSCSSSSSTPDPGASSGGDPNADPQAQNPNSPQLFSKQIAHVAIEVAYVPGAEPYVGTQGDFGDIWSLFKSNAGAVFDGKKDVKLPTTLAGMDKLADVPAGDMSKQDLLDLATSHRKNASNADAQLQAYYVVFVNGHLKGDDGTPQTDVTGVSIGDSGVIGIFKPAYTGYFNKKSPVAQMIEQIAVIHQFGHAIGWVNHGVPIAAANQQHEDGAHSGHCTNKQCAMTWAFESAKGIATFIGNFPVSEQSVLYELVCLSDVRILESSLSGGSAPPRAPRAGPPRERERASARRLGCE